MSIMSEALSGESRHALMDKQNMLIRDEARCTDKATFALFNRIVI